MKDGGHVDCSVGLSSKIDVVRQATREIHLLGHVPVIVRASEFAVCCGVVVLSLTSRLNIYWTCRQMLQPMHRYRLTGRMKVVNSISWKQIGVCQLSAEPEVPVRILGRCVVPMASMEDNMLRTEYVVDVIIRDGSNNGDR